ncbi:unnamed protein product, partial [Mesorhabditis spiculigera]
MLISRENQAEQQTTLKEQLATVTKEKDDALAQLSVVSTSNRRADRYFKQGNWMGEKAYDQGITCSKCLTKSTCSNLLDPAPPLAIVPRNIGVMAPVNAYSSPPFQGDLWGRTVVRTTTQERPQKETRTPLL